MIEKVEISVAYYSNRRGEGKRLSHSISEEWMPTTLFCPRCAEKQVWHEGGVGDYYVGERYICISCQGEFYLPGGINDAKGEQNEQRLQTLKSKIPL